MTTEPDTKECPFCGETIKATAKKCKHCGEFLDGYTRDKVWQKVNTDGGAAVGRDVSVGRDFAGRDLIKIGKNQRDEQYEIALNWDRKTLLRGFDLSGQDLSEWNLTVTADLTKANLQNAILFKANLRGADLRRANLRGANLRYANLSDANLSWADLQGANLYYAILRNTKLSGAHLDKADLRYANLTEAYWYPNADAFVTPEHHEHLITTIHEVRYNRYTRWPYPGFIPPSDAINVDVE